MLAYLAEKKLTTVEPRYTMTATVKYYWAHQAKFCEDVMLYMLRQDVYLASFYDWFDSSMDTISYDEPFTEQVVSFVGSFLTEPVWQDPMRQLGLSMRATLPVHPLVSRAFDEIDRREANFWDQLLLAVANKRQFHMESSVGIDLVDRLRMFLDGAQLRYAMWGKDTPREHLVAVDAVRDLITGFVERRIDNNLVIWDYPDAPQSPEPLNAFEEEMAPSGRHG